MNTYLVTLLPNGDELLPYVVKTHAYTVDFAILYAKEFVAKNRYWSSTKSIEEIMNCLKVKSIKCVDTGQIIIH